MTNYYMIMVDTDSVFYKGFVGGVFQTKKGTSHPVGPSDISVYKLDSSIEKINWNFDEKPFLAFDYTKYEGHIIRENMWNIVKKYRVADYKERTINVWIEGELFESDFKHIFFEMPTQRERLETYEHLVFFDENKSEFEIGKFHLKIPTGEMVLTENAKNYDCFELRGGIKGIGSNLVVNENLAKKLLSENLKGIKIVPLRDAFRTFCNDSMLSLDNLLPRRKTKNKGNNKDKRSNLGSS